MLSNKHLIAPEVTVPRRSTDFQLDLQDSVMGKDFQSAPSRSIFHRVLARPDGPERMLRERGTPKDELDVSCWNQCDGVVTSLLFALHPNEIAKLLRPLRFDKDRLIGSGMSKTETLRMQCNARIRPCPMFRLTRPVSRIAKDRMS